LSLSLDGPFAGDLDNGQNNLVLRAAQTLLEATGGPRGAAINLSKNLPVASGIGGGSADAAATLRALVSLWQIDVDDVALAQIGLSLGADVPACLFARPARMQGVGEKLDAAGPLPDIGLVLVNPGVAVSTGRVFGAMQGAYSQTALFPSRISSQHDLIAALGETRNDLTLPAIGLSPQIGDVLDVLNAEPGCLLARLSGSGATCFGLFPDTEKADQAARKIQRDQNGWWVHGGRFLTEPPALTPV
jgi:4-diphosphocytidyl-2-C-methyl-D-erythritol kinase